MLISDAIQVPCAIGIDCNHVPFMEKMDAIEFPAPVVLGLRFGGLPPLNSAFHNTLVYVFAQLPAQYNLSSSKDFISLLIPCDITLPLVPVPSTAQVYLHSILGEEVKDVELALRKPRLMMVLVQLPPLRFETFEP